MKTIKYIFLVFGAIVMLFPSCTKDFEETNKNPNSPEQVPSYTLMTNAQKRLMDDTRDEWFSGRMALPWIQYWAQVNYTEEDRYQYRENSNNTAWKDIYTDLMDLQRVIELNENAETKALNGAYGNNDNQIAAARILKSWAFHLLTDTYGPVPYHSYTTQDDDFQALRGLSENILSPTYAPMDKIYKDILNELKEAAATLSTNADKYVLTQGDIIYGGNADLWRRFANSLRLRVALRMRGVDQATADLHINELTADIDGNLFRSNDDNAQFSYLETSDNASPMYRAYYVDNRTDFAVSNAFIDLLSGKKTTLTGIEDPRIHTFACPKGLNSKDLALMQANEIFAMPVTDYAGQPYGIVSETAGAIPIGDVSLPFYPLKATYGEVFMDYAEVCFILSELQGWDQTWYEKGVEASMLQWEVPAENITLYMETLPAADEENVMTQKYIALYMQPYQAWAEYRRTGYPNTLTLPGQVTWVDENGEDVIFEPLVDTDGDLPKRVGYSQEEQLLNPDGYDKGKSLLGGADNMYTPLWWDVN